MAEKPTTPPATTPAYDVAAGTPVKISVRYADWHVDDGDQPIIVGRPWRVAIELQRTSIVDGTDWWPTVEPVHGNPPTGLQQLPGEPGGYRYVAQAVQLEEEPHEAPWTVLEASGVRFAVPGRYEGRVEGSGIFVHDTYIIESGSVREAVTQQFTVALIQYLPHRYKRRAGVWGWMMTPLFEGFGEPHEVRDTRQVEPLVIPGTFLITLQVKR